MKPDITIPGGARLALGNLHHSRFTTCISCGEHSEQPLLNTQWSSGESSRNFPETWPADATTPIPDINPAWQKLTVFQHHFARLRSPLLKVRRTGNAGHIEKTPFDESEVRQMRVTLTAHFLMVKTNFAGDSTDQ